MIFIPQCTGEKPTAMFLYKDHSEELIKTLKEQKRGRKGLKCL